ncbi:MAG: hypothetical protein ACOX1V_02245 [Candidatus Iainarchaeum sp.]|jgi:predicted RNase H-like nuclease (RuvC/YqgF family)|nr:MAG: hypothetical protein BWY55_00337 [archaeon ADurb.Bin336]
MARPDRSNPQARGNYARPPQRQGAPMQQGMPSAGGVREDIRALNSSILLISQKMKFLARNEKILGRNLVVLNKKIKNLEDKLNLAPKEESSSSSVSSKDVEDLKQRITLLEAQLEDLRSRSASVENLKELKYVIDSINPLEFATLSQVRDLIDKRLKNKESP